MQEDKKLQSLLAAYAVQETSAGFEGMVMQRVMACPKVHAAPLMSNLLKTILLTAGGLVAVALLVTSAFINPNIYTGYSFMHISQNVYTQLFSFFAVFWIVMLVNLLVNRKKVLLTV